MEYESEMLAGTQAGHISDELDVKLNELSEAGRKVHAALEELLGEASGVSYSDDESGSDARKVMQSCVWNHVGAANAGVGRVGRLHTEARAAQAVQNETEDGSAVGLAGVAREF